MSSADRLGELWSKHSEALRFSVAVCLMEDITTELQTNVLTKYEKDYSPVIMLCQCENAEELLHTLTYDCNY